MRRRSMMWRVLAFRCRFTDRMSHSAITSSMSSGDPRNSRGTWSSTSVGIMRTSMAEILDPERMGAQGELLAAGAVADDRQLLAVQPDALRVVVGAAVEVAGRRLVLGGEQQDEHHGVLGQRFCAQVAGAVRERDPPGQDVLHLDVVQAVGLHLEVADAGRRGKVDPLLARVAAHVDHDLDAVELRCRRHRVVERPGVVPFADRRQVAVRAAFGNRYARLCEKENS